MEEKGKKLEEAIRKGRVNGDGEESVSKYE